MPLVLVRVDCRLIHGQVIESWVPYTKADYLLVANDDLANDELQQTIMKMAVPPTIKVEVSSVMDAARKLQNGLENHRRVILLVENCEDALRCYRHGLKFNALNLGNLVCTESKRQVTCSIYLDDRDLECLREITQSGITVEARPVPDSHSTSLGQILVPVPRGLD